VKLQLLAINRVVHPDSQHIDGVKGEEDMKSKKYTFGNSTVIVHSPLVDLSKKDRQNWYKNEWKKGNRVLKEIVSAVQDCLQNSN